MSDSANEYVTRSVRLRETGTAFHIKSGRSHFHLCHTFIISCQETPPPLLPLLPLSQCQNNTFGIYWISCILLFLNSPERIAELWQGEKWVILWWVLWFIIRCSSAKCTKGVSLFRLFFLLSPGFCNDDVLPTLFPSSDLTLAQESTFNIVFGLFFFFLPGDIDGRKCASPLPGWYF